MDDIQIDSKNQKSSKKSKKSRSAWQYMFDLIIKTILCGVILSIDFTLFANAGSYNLFSSAMYGNLEALYIYAGIGAVSFILMFISSFVRPLENIVLSIVLALFTVAIINQFATFEKHSGLLILFEGIFSDEANVFMYKNSHMIIALLVFVVSWIILSLLKRQYIFYITVTTHSAL